MEGDVKEFYTQKAKQKPSLTSEEYDKVKVKLWIVKDWMRVGEGGGGREEGGITNSTVNPQVNKETWCIFSAPSAERRFGGSLVIFFQMIMHLATKQKA